MLVGIALVMHHRAGESEGPYRPLVSGRTRDLARFVYVLTIGVLVLGTLVTAAGPHGGDDRARRLGWALGDVARVHGIAVDVLVASTLVLVILLARSRVPRRVLNVASLTIVVMAAQGVLGYVQYWNEIPAVLVGFHVFGAVSVFMCVQQLMLELRVPVRQPALALEEESATDGASTPTRALPASTGR
jgi:cytochrome c oxidase assembly protein subunit 15